MAKVERRPCYFNKSLQKKYPFIRKQKNKTDSDVFCKICSSKFSIANGGLTHLRRHVTTAKHLRAIREATDSQSDSDESQSIPTGNKRKRKIKDVPSNDDTLKDDLDYSGTSNQQEENDFEAYWFDPEMAQETSTADDGAAAGSSPSYSDQEQKYKPHTNHHRTSTSKQMLGHPQTIPRNERTLSVQRMKMFEAELRVWQRKGEAIVKLMETVGQDKEMWEIINKQSRLHERERDRIREEYDIL